jgi:transcriptional regulator with XRE-family HTH domain
MQQSIGELIKEARAQKDWSVKLLARRSGVKISTINSIEAGKSRNPRVDTLVALEKALGITLDTMRSDALNDEQLSLIDAWDKLNKEQQRWFLSQIKNQATINTLKNIDL